MDIYSTINWTHGVKVQIFAVKKQGIYSNFFSVFRELPFPSRELNNWTKQKGKNNLNLFECYMTVEEGKNFFQKLQQDQSILFICKEKEVSVQFGKLLARPTLFMPNLPENSLSRGWWPGTLNEGFHFDMLFGNVEIQITTQAKKNAFQFIKEKASIHIEFLQDLLGSVLYLYGDEQQSISFGFNPDSRYLYFAVNGEISPKDRRVLLQAWEGEEALEAKLFDLKNLEPIITTKLSFLPSQIGYHLYEYTNSEWKLTKQHSAPLMRDIHIQMNVTVGKLTVRKGDKTEEHDITVRQSPIKTVPSDNQQPWLAEEMQRLKNNKGIEIRQLGSLFLRGGSSHQDSWQLIVDDVLEKADQRVWIWDPYLDETILDELIILGIKRGMDIRLLLSEYKGEKVAGNEQCSTKKETGSTGSQNDSFPRCRAIYQYLQQEQFKNLNHFQVRNWFRSGKHCFHDRFIIIDNHVWNIGSSLKDIGNYHTTIYRLEGDLPDQVIQEFQKGWSGDFGHMEPTGLSVYPDWHYIGGDHHE